MHTRKPELQMEFEYQPILKQQATLTVLSRRTGFPASALEDFANQGFLPEVCVDKVTGQKRFDGMVFLRRLVEIEDGE